MDSRRLKLWCTSVVEQCLTVGDCWSAIVLSISKVNFELFFVSRRITIFIPREKSHQLRMFEAFQTESKAFLFPSLLQSFQTSHFKCILVVVIFFSQYYFEAGGLNSLNCLLLLFGQWAVEGHADIFGPEPPTDSEFLSFFVLYSRLLADFHEPNLLSSTVQSSFTPWRLWHKSR